jgi:hypothetical protein
MSDFIPDDDQELPNTPEMAHALRQIASGRCARFGRNFRGCEIAEQLATRGEPHWFLDLLALWRPAGEASGDEGLRLAVRNGYLNFYRRGQSVARVSTVRGELRGVVHAKYFSEAARERGGQTYGRFFGSRVTSAHGSEPYEGLSTLRQWIALIDERYAGTEKQLVDQLVSENANVIDLEMGLPAWGRRKAPLRMDLVTIEDQQIVFWEAKCAGDSRIRCRGASAMPEVVRQLQEYRDFLVQDTHCVRIAEAYRSAAAVLVRLRAVADRIGPTCALGPAIVAAKDVDLGVAREAALVVIDENAVEEHAPAGVRWQSWHTNGHASKLRGAVKVLAQSRPGRLRLEDAV